jgi:TPR repeat protein
MPQRWMTFFAAAVLVVATAVVGTAQQESTEELRANAEQGDAAAQSSLGFLYNFGALGVPQDYAEAARWYRLAAEQGNTTAQYNLGTSYIDGRGVPRDGTEAVRWYQLAAVQNFGSAMLELGLMYGMGTGVPQDDVTAHMWLNLSAARAGPEIVRDLAVKGRDDVASRLTPDLRAEAQRLAREWDEAHPRD